MKLMFSNVGKINSKIEDEPFVDNECKIIDINNW